MDQPGHLYVLKRASDGALVPAGELLCSRLAEAIGLPTPTHCIARMPGSDELVFASQVDQRHLGLEQLAALLAQPDILHAIAPQFSRWYAFDTFVQNTDRHLGNYLLIEQWGDHHLWGIDYSRSLLNQGWPQARPPLPHCHTVRVRHFICQREPLPAPAAASIASALGRLADDWLEQAMADIPEQWLDATVRPRLDRWWRKHRHRRIRLLRRHMGNGRYLRICADPRGARPPAR